MIRKVALGTVAASAVLGLLVAQMHGGIFPRWSVWLIVLGVAVVVGGGIWFAVRDRGYIEPDSSDVTRHRSASVNTLGTHPDHITISQILERVTERQTYAVTGNPKQLRALAPGSAWDHVQAIEASQQAPPKIED
jgi:hypothetical protein